MQSEECSHAGLTCNHFCRTCKAGGTQEFKRSDEGFQTLFEVNSHFYMVHLWQTLTE